MDTDRLWETAGPAVRRAFMRAALSELLELAFTTLPATVDRGIAVDYTELVARRLQSRINALDRAWEIDEPPRDAREQITEAFETIRICARAIVANQPTPVQSVTMGISLVPETPAVRRVIGSRLADGIVYMGLRLFAEVPHSLIRLCAFSESCGRVFVGTRSQKFCAEHQADARRLIHRKAIRAFRKRQAKKKRRQR